MESRALDSKIHVQDSIKDSKVDSIKGFAKFRLIFILAFLSAIAPLSTDMYLPALPNVAKSFAVDDFYAQLSLASFFTAFAFGQLLYGPLSDIFGRKKPLYVGLALFILSSVGCVLVDSIHLFIALRFFEALGGYSGVVIARAIVNDRFEVKDAVGVFALMMVVSSLAPMLSPSFGSILLKFFSWHSIFATLFILGVVLFFLVMFYLPDSKNFTKDSKDSIESKRNLNKLDSKDSSQIHHAQDSIESNILSPTHHPTTKPHFNAFATYLRILKDKTFMIYIISGALAMAAMFAYITGSSFVFINIFHLSSEGYALIFAMNACGFIVCANVNARLVKSIDCVKIINVAFILMCIFSVILALVGILSNNVVADSKDLSFIDFFSFKAGVKFVFFELMLLCTLSMLGFLLPNITTLAMARYKDVSGSASALLGATQFGLAGLTSFLVGALNANTTMLLGCVMCGCVLCGTFLYFFGKDSK
ncbi:multidrug effflux MFS transporter [Helicobacter saguini]|nr:multidrug effflux MFS transporter [Helicobacter saguini]